MSVACPPEPLAVGSGSLKCFGCIRASDPHRPTQGRENDLHSLHLAGLEMWVSEKGGGLVSQFFCC